MGTEVLVCDGTGRVVATTAEPREVHHDDLELAMLSSGVCGTDLHKLAHQRAGAGSVLGHEIVGRVLRGPADLVGERVAVAHHLSCGHCDLCRRDLEPACPAYRENLLDPGGFAQTIRVRRRALDGALVVLPGDLDELAALFFEPLACTVRGLRRGGLLDGPGGREVAILGGGGTGLLHLLAVRALDPAPTITVVEPRDDRRELAIQLGAIGLTPAEQQALRGRCDLVIEASGAAAALSAAPALLATGGTLVLFAHSPADFELRLDPNQLFAAERRIVASYSSGTRDRELAWQLLCDRRVDPRPLVDRLVPLAEGADAIAEARAGRWIKVVLQGPTNYDRANCDRASCDRAS